MHVLTRITVATATLVAAAGAVFILGPHPESPPPPPEPPAYVPPAENGPPVLTQRKGEWSPTCQQSGQPLIDFSPIDRGSNNTRVLLTVFNCSDSPVEVGEPTLWLGGRKGMTDFLSLDPADTHLTPLLLPGRSSAQAVLSWQGGGQGDTLSVSIPGIGEGELRDNLGLDHSSRVWLSGWNR